MAKDKNGSERECSNCHNNTRLDRALVIQQNGYVVAVLCEECQHAKKIQVTLSRAQRDARWEFYQFFPLEA